MSEKAAADGQVSLQQADVPRVDALPLGVTVVVLIFTYWCVDIVSPALPTIQESLALNATSAGLIFSVFFAGRLVTNLPAAWFVERSGPRWTAALGAGALLAGSFLAAGASSQAALLPARGIQGAGVAFLATAGLLSVLRALPGGGAAMTAFNVASGVGSSAGLLSGGFLATDVGWRSIFVLSGTVSAALLVATLVSQGRGVTARPIRREAPLPRAKQHFSRLEIAAIAANLLVYANYSIWVVSLPLLGAVKFGFDASRVGFMLLFVNVIHLASAFPVGGVIAKAGAQWTLAAGFGIVGLGLVLTPRAPDIVWLTAPLLLYAVGQVAGNSAAGDLILRLGGGGGRAVGAVRLSSDVGMVVGPAVVGVIADHFGVEAPFSLFGVAALIAMAAFAVVVVGQRRRRHGF